MRAVAALLVFMLAPQVAHACTFTPTVWGFEPRLDGTVDVATDVGLMLAANFAQLEVELVPAAGGAPVTGTLTTLRAREDHLPWKRWTPDTPLAPNTTYVATVTPLMWEDMTGPDTATFTTGAGPAAAPSAPVLAQVTFGGPWGPMVYGGCVSSHHERPVTVDVEVPAVEALSWLELWDDAGLQLREEVVGGPTTLQLDWTQWTLGGVPVDDPAYDCLTPVLVTPSGERLEGAEVCGAPVPGDTGDTGGTAGAGGGGGFGGVGADREPLGPGDPAVADTASGFEPEDTAAPAAAPEPERAGAAGCGCASTGGPGGPGGTLAIGAVLLLVRRRTPGRRGTRA